MSVWLALMPVLVGSYGMARVLDLDTDVSEVVRDWWRRMRWSGRHSVRWVREQERAARRRQAREEAAARDALDRVWVTGLAEWAARARGDGLDRGRVAVRWT